MKLTVWCLACLACLTILAVTGVGLGLLWTNYEPYEQKIEFGHDFENRIKKEFFGTNRHVYFIPIETDKKLSEDSEDLIAIANILNVGRDEPTQKVTLHSTESQELFISGIRPINRVGIFVFVQGSTDAYGVTNGIKRIYVAPMKQPYAFVTHKEEYPFPSNPNGWSIKSFDHKSAIFQYNNMGTIIAFTVFASLFAFFAISVIVLFAYDYQSSNA